MDDVDKGLMFFKEKVTGYEKGVRSETIVERKKERVVNRGIRKLGII